MRFALLALSSCFLVIVTIRPSATAEKRALRQPAVVTAKAPITPRYQLSKADRQEFAYILKQARLGKIPTTKLSETIQAIAHQYRGYPYSANLLDKTEPEVLQLSLKNFDCVLFVEAMLGLAHTIRQPHPTESHFVEQMQAQRYRNGKIDNYCSRLHYFSEWILENQRQGRVKDLGDELGGIALDRSLHFMSQNWRKYPRQKLSANRDCIRAMESDLGQVNLKYVPTHRIRSVYHKLQPGDIVAIATNIHGLDVTHTGLVYRNAKGNIGMIHAAPNAGVIISPDLQSYVVRLGNKSTGILVARPLTGSVF